MWWLVYVGIIGAMVVPMLGVAFGLRCYKKRVVQTGKASVLVSIIISLVLAAVSVYFVTVLLETDPPATYLIWFGIFGYLLLTDIVYIRIMFFTKWAKRCMGITIKKSASVEPPKRRITKIEDIGKDWERKMEEE